MKRFFLVDCNNFYASCERVFNPKLTKKPIVVLSSNDACIIARSNEAKALGIAMGVPLFECEAVVKKHNVYVFSANFALYGDMSSRVMQTLTSLATDIEIYSVDEAFLFVSEHQARMSAPDKADYFAQYGHAMRTQVKQNTGIPVSIGIGPTKTLAKIANRIAKKNPTYNGVFDITDYPDSDALLSTIAVEDIWGIGYRYARLLSSKGIKTARDFKYLCSQWVRKHMTIVGVKTQLELQGISCIDLQLVPQEKKSITVSRSFGKIVTDIRFLQEAAAAYMTTAAEKLRSQQSVTSYISVFAITMKYHDANRYYSSADFQLPIATSYTPELIDAAHECIKKLFIPGCYYKKVGVLLHEVIPASSIQMNTFTQLGDLKKQSQLMQTLDRANQKFGRNTLSFAAAGIEQHWKMKQLKKSQCFTTNWNELLTIRV